MTEADRQAPPISLTSGEEWALHEHLCWGEDGDTLLVEHIRGGGTYATYVAAWKAARDQTAGEDTAGDAELGARILTLVIPHHSNYCGGMTIREWLVALFGQLWAGTERYDMCGNSDWRYSAYDALNAAGLIPGWRDGHGVGYRSDGSEHPEDRARADELIGLAIDALDVPDRPVWTAEQAYNLLRDLPASTVRLVRAVVGNGGEISANQLRAQGATLRGVTGPIRKAVERHANQGAAPHGLPLPLEARYDRQNQRATAFAVPAECLAPFAAALARIDRPPPTVTT